MLLPAPARRLRLPQMPEGTRWRRHGVNVFSPPRHAAPVVLWLCPRVKAAQAVETLRAAAIHGIYLLHTPSLSLLFVCCLPLRCRLFPGCLTVSSLWAPDQCGAALLLWSLVLPTCLSLLRRRLRVGVSAFIISLVPCRRPGPCAGVATCRAGLPEGSNSQERGPKNLRHHQKQWAPWLSVSFG